MTARSTPTPYAQLDCWSGVEGDIGARILLLGLLVTLVLGAAPARATFRGENGRIGAAYFFDDSTPCGDGLHICENDSFDAAVSFTVRSGARREYAHCACAPSRVQWSPDGRRVTFSLSTPGPLMVAAADREGPGRTIPGIEGSDPAWSPGGQWIVYSSDGGLRVVRRDGSRDRLLTHNQKPYIRDERPAWCRDGRIVFTRGGELMSVRVDGRAVRSLGGSLNSDFGGYPDCTPTGESAIWADRTAHGVYVARNDGGGKRHRLFRGDMDDPVLSPDGRFVAYFEHYGIWRARRDGTHRRRISVGEPPREGYWAPSWQAR